MGEITYQHNAPLNPQSVARLLDASGIKRPTHDLPRIARMYAAPCLTVSAWMDGQLIGIARALTDYAYSCYLADLAVDRACQGRGIGRELVRQIQAVIGERVSLDLHAAPGAMSYYPTLGFELCDNAWRIPRKS